MATIHLTPVYNKLLLTTNWIVQKLCNNINYDKLWKGRWIWGCLHKAGPVIDKPDCESTV